MHKNAAHYSQYGNATSSASAISSAGTRTAPVGVQRSPRPLARFRKMSPSIIASAQLAMCQDLPDVNKSEVSITLKRAAPALGINGTSYHILDILLGLTRAQDWSGNNHPVVAISNQRLAEYTMRSTRTIIRCIRKLVEAGILSYRDSPTGRRYVHQQKTSGTSKTENERIAYGLDFTPARARFNELKKIGEDYRERLNHQREQRRSISRLSRMINDLALAAEIETSLSLTQTLKQNLELACPAAQESALTELYQHALTLSQPAIHNSLNMHASEVSESSETIAPQPSENLSATIAEPVCAEIVNAEAMTEISANVSSTGDIDVSSIIKTSSFHTIACSESLDSSQQKNVLLNDSISNFSKKSKLTSQQTNQANHKQCSLSNISSELISSSCTETQEVLQERFTSWDRIAQSGDKLRRIIGIDEHSFQSVLVRCGRHLTAVLLALITEKLMRGENNVRNPSGYFLGLAGRSETGNLNLQASFYGLLESKVPA